jgi:hypothetical protein
MNSRLFLLLPALLPAALLASCMSNEEYRRKLDKRNESYRQFEERLQMYSESMDERYETWVDRVLD